MNHIIITEGGRVTVNCKVTDQYKDEVLKRLEGLQGVLVKSWVEENKQKKAKASKRLFTHNEIENGD